MNKKLPEFKNIPSIERLTFGDYDEAHHLLCYTSSQKEGVWLRNISDETEQKITANGGGEGNPFFSPDGTKLYFVSSTNLGRQLYSYDIQTEEVVPITHSDAPVIDPVLSPDGTKLLFAAPVSAGTAVDYSAEKVNDLDDSLVIEDFGYKFDGMGYITPDDHMHLFVADMKSGDCVRLTTGICDFLHHTWSVDGKFAICVSDCNRSKEEGLGYDLMKIDIDSHEVTQISKDLWMVSYPNPMRPVVTPDGKYVIMGVLDPSQDMNQDDTYPEVYLYRFAMDGSGAESIFQPNEHCYQCVQFPYNAGCGWGFEKLRLSEDGKYAYFFSGWQGQGNLYRVPVAGGEAERIAGGKQVYHGMSRIQNGKCILCCSKPNVPEEYYRMDLSSGEKISCVKQSAEKYMAETEISEANDFFFDTKDGKDRVHGFVLPPQNRVEGEKYPAIVYIHGGPHPFYTYGFTPEHQCFAAQGFAVIYCNPRGSSGYGYEHQRVAQAMDGTAYQDILQLVDEAVARFDWIDSERVGVTGGSYGGYMTNYIATHSNRFKAYVAQRSTCNEMITYASSDMQGSSKKYDSYEKFMLDKIAGSSVAYAEKIERPLLILHGEEDYRCPVEEAHQLFVALKDVHPDLPVRLVIYPHLNHDQPSDPGQQLHYYNEMTSWFKKYL
jgi:dipeptidyl aminopeptidase/acylaminoacyl peptidase